MQRLLAGIVAFALSSGVMAGLASAGPIGTVEWNNATFTVELTGNAGNNYSFEIVADFTGFAETDQSGHFDYLVGINFKPNGGNLTGVVGVPTTNASGASWGYGVDSNLNSNSSDCSSSGNNDFFCGILLNTADWEANPTAGNPVYSWQFTTTITGVSNPESLVAGTGLRALFTDGGTRYKTSLMSETTLRSETPPHRVPEPATSSLSLLGFGVATALGFRKRAA